MSSTCFYDSKLNIQVLDFWVLKNDFINTFSIKDYYRISYFRKGKFLCYFENKRIDINEGTILVTKFNEDFKIKTNVDITDSFVRTEIITINIHPTLFKGIKGDNDFYRLFNNPVSKIEDNIYTLNEFVDFDVEENIFKNIARYINNNLGLINFLGLVLTLITELNMLFDKKNNIECSNNSDEYMVKVYDYISKNFANDITLEGLAKKFSVSKFYIEKVTKKFYSQSFHQTIINMRMWHSRDLMKGDKNISLMEIAQLCGYSDYSGFYRVYVKFFKVSPKKNFEYYKKHNTFLSDLKS